MNILKQNKFAILGGLLLCIGLFYYFSGGSDTSQPLVASTGEADPTTAGLLATLSNLQTIELDNSIFNDPVFLSLTDFGVIIPPQDVGRRNPFAPIGSVSRFVATSTRAQ